MTDRIIRTFGRAYGVQPAEISVQFAGSPVYEGPVPTYDEWPADYGTQPREPLFDFRISMDQYGIVPMRYQVLQGLVMFDHVECNYQAIPNPVFSDEQRQILLDVHAKHLVHSLSISDEQYISVLIEVANPPLSSTEVDLLASLNDDDGAAKLALLESRGLKLLIAGNADQFAEVRWQGDSRTNVRLDGHVLMRSADPPGTWSWLVNQGQTLEFDLIIDPRRLD